MLRHCYLWQHHLQSQAFSRQVRLHGAWGSKLEDVVHAWCWMSGPCAASSTSLQSFFLTIGRSPDLQRGLALQCITATRQARSPAVTPTSSRAGTCVQAGSTLPPTRQSSKRAGIPNQQGSRLQKQYAAQPQQRLILQGRKRDISPPQAASSTTSDSAGSSARQAQATTTQTQEPGIKARANAPSGRQQQTSQAARSGDEQEVPGNEPGTVCTS